jgi:hypothetical protein
MEDHELAEQLLQDHFVASATLIALMLKNLPDDVQTRNTRRRAQRHWQGRGKSARRVE